MSQEAVFKASLFQSLCLVGAIRREDGRLRPDIGALEAFVEAYAARSNRAFAVESDRIDLFYGRSVTIAVRDILRAASDCVRLARAARRSGLAVELCLGLDEYQAERDAAARCLGEVDLLYFSVPPDFDPARADELRLALDELMAGRTTLSLNANPTLLRSLGLLRDPAYNGRYMSLFAARPEPGRHVRVPGVAAMPCQSFLRLYVDNLGDVYPCGSLVGFEPARMGNIHDVDVERLWRPKPRFDYRSVALTGPDLDYREAPLPFDLCAAHRAQLAEALP